MALALRAGYAVRALMRAVIASRKRSPAPNGIDDFDDVAIGKTMLRMPASRHDGLVDLDRDTTSAETVAFEQFGQGRRVRKRLRLSVEMNLHGGNGT